MLLNSYSKIESSVVGGPKKQHDGRVRSGDTKIPYQLNLKGELGSD